MITHSTTLKLPDPMLRAACDLARARDVSVGQVIRDALAAEIRRSDRNAKSKAQKRADEALLSSLRSLLAQDLADATSWPDLIERLRRKGFVFREAGGGLALYSTDHRARLCKASDLGYSYGALMKRFGTPFPSNNLTKATTTTRLQTPHYAEGFAEDSLGVIDF